MHIFMPSLGVGVFFVVSVTRCIVVLFHVRIRAYLFLRNASFRSLYVFFELCAVTWNGVSVVGCRRVESL